MKKTFNYNSNKVFNVCKKALEDLEMNLEYNNKLASAK
jgi:hypothetical protein